MMFVFPMAGESRRFREAGFEAPKYRLPLNGATVFDHVVTGFAAYFREDAFLFIVLDGEAAAFVGARSRALNIAHSKIVTLTHGTGCQAETVLCSLELLNASPDEQLAIFNIDTIRHGYTKPRVLM